MKKPWEKYWEPFDKCVIRLSITRSKPRYWYSYTRRKKNRNKHDRELHILSLTKVRHHGSLLSAYRLIVGPIMFMIGW